MFRAALFDTIGCDDYVLWLEYGRVELAVPAVRENVVGMIKVSKVMRVMTSKTQSNPRIFDFVRKMTPKRALAQMCSKLLHPNVCCC